jgi:hypothetical protein
VPLDADRIRAIRSTFGSGKAVALIPAHQRPVRPGLTGRWLISQRSIDHDARLPLERLVRREQLRQSGCCGITFATARSFQIPAAATPTRFSSFHREIV